MSEIKIKWDGDVIVLPLEEAEGLAESLDAEGESFEWERIEDSAPESKPVSKPAPFFATEGRERKIDHTRDSIAQASDARKAAAESRKAREKRAAEENVPAWVIRIREGLRRARDKNNENNGIVLRRPDGSWYWFDESGRMENLPRNAGNWFSPGQQT